MKNRQKHKGGDRFTRRPQAQKKPNPFEIRSIASKKFSVLDSRKPLNRTHAPGISRKRGIELVNILRGFFAIFFSVMLEPELTVVLWYIQRVMIGNSYHWII